MAKLGIYPKLTKDLILSKVSQEQIFEKYLGINVEFGQNINVPDIIRGINTDSNASGSFKWIGSKLRFKDFAGYFWGDCFDAVAFVHNISSNSKQGFVQILEIVARDFDIRSSRTMTTPPRIESLSSQFLPGGGGNGKKVIEIEKRPWNKEDAEYWTKSYIYKAALNYFDVFACSAVWVNSQLIYTYNPKDPAYAYWFGKDTNGIDDIKIYFPYRKDYRFIMNYSSVEGLKKIRPAELLVITKSYKDVMSINCITKGAFSIEAISPSSETHLIPKDIFYGLWNNYEYIVSLMDFDFTGRNMAWKLRNIYNVPPLFLTNGTRGTPDFGAKDFSAYVNKNGRDKTLALVGNARDYIIKKFAK